MADSTLPAVKKSAPRGLIPARVLVVDPEPLIRWSICVALSAAGFALLDVHSNGQPQQLINQIRTSSPGSRFVLMSTGRQTTETLPELGEVQVLEKPFDLTKLVSVVIELAGTAASTAGDRR